MKVLPVKKRHLIPEKSANIGTNATEKTRVIWNSSDILQKVGLDSSLNWIEIKTEPSVKDKWKILDGFSVVLTGAEDANEAEDEDNGEEEDDEELRPMIEMADGEIIDVKGGAYRIKRTAYYCTWVSVDPHWGKQGATIGWGTCFLRCRPSQELTENAPKFFFKTICLVC